MTVDGLTLTVLGCAGSYAGPDNACSGYLVRSPGSTVVVDLGNGTLANLQRHVALAGLDAVVLSHSHPDHWLDLPILRNALRYYLMVEGLDVYGTAEILEQARVVIGDLEPTLRWTTISADMPGLTIGDMSFRFSRTDHPVETLAVRVEAAGSTFVYTADTGSRWAPDGVDFAAGAVLLLSEAATPEKYEDETQHLTGRQAGGLARDAGAGRLVLTHIAPGTSAEGQVAAAAGAFDGPVSVAEVHSTLAV